MGLTFRAAGTAVLSAAAITAHAQPVLEPLPSATLLGGSPLHVPLVAGPADGPAVTFTAQSSDPTLVATTVLSANRSLRIRVAERGEMVFQLFEQRVPRATQHISALAESGFYDGVGFHRIVDGFVIQGGDPTGTGTGGSPLGVFDDQFDVDLQHNRTGLLSMAKAVDDGNDSQFFVTEGPSRHLDFQHTIFGLLTRGEEVREAISGVPVDSSSRPVSPVVMESVSVFDDPGAGVLMLKAPEGASGSAMVTITAVDDAGAVTLGSFVVTVMPDDVDTDPFLADVPPLVTRINTRFTYQLTAVDAEGDASAYLDERRMDVNGLAVPVRAPADVDYEVEFDTGLLTVTPRNGLVGEVKLSVAVGVRPQAIDYQVLTITIDP